jgi:hypothetical protein
MELKMKTLTILFALLSMAVAADSVMSASWSNAGMSEAGKTLNAALITGNPLGARAGPSTNASIPRTGASAAT